MLESIPRCEGVARNEAHLGSTRDPGELLVVSGEQKGPASPAAGERLLDS